MELSHNSLTPACVRIVCDVIHSVVHIVCVPVWFIQWCSSVCKVIHSVELSSTIVWTPYSVCSSVCSYSVCSFIVWFI